MESTRFISMILLFGAFAFISGLEVPEHLKKHAERLHNKCQSETGVEEDLIVQSQNGNLPDDRKLQCYIHCLFQTTGLIDEENIIHLEHIIDILPTEVHEIINNLVNICGTKHGADPCETAYLTVKCYFDADPEHSMLI